MGTACAPASLDDRWVPARWECLQCARVIGPGDALHCVECGRPARLAAGDEVLLEDVEMEVP